MTSTETCSACACAIPDSVMHFVYQNEDDDDLRLCGACEKKNAKKKSWLKKWRMIEVWKFGTSVDVSDDTEFEERYVPDISDSAFAVEEEKEEKDIFESFTIKYPLTKKYAEEEMTAAIKHWSPEILATVIAESVMIIANFKNGLYDKCRINKTKDPAEEEAFIDGMCFNYLKHAVKNINILFANCGNWNMIIEAFSEVKSFDAHQFVVIALNKYGRAV